MVNFNSKIINLADFWPRWYVVRGEIDKDSNKYQTISCMARNLDENW